MKLSTRLALLAGLSVAGAFTAGAWAAEGMRGLKIVAMDESGKEMVDVPLYSKTHAVIIGIDHYPALKPEQQLIHAVSDAKAVEILLRSKFVFSEIHTLYNGDATKDRILDLLLNKLANISENDAVFVFFAGHGGQEQTNYGPIGFIIPHDGDFSDMRRVISMTMIRDDISKRIKAKHVYYVMDACYSGILAMTRGTERDTKRDLRYLQQIADEPVRQVLTAGSADQRVLDGGPGGHSVFAGRFLEILDGATDFLTATEVSALVKERVFSDAHARGHRQTPTSGELFGIGDFIFMPSVTKKLGSLQDQISALEGEIEQLKAAEAKAARMQDETARREAERLTSVAAAKLEAKKLEEERVRQEQLAKAERDRQQRNEREELSRRQEAEAARLEVLQKQVQQKREEQETSMVASLAEATQEMQSLEKEIRTISDNYREELKNRVLAIARAHSDAFGDVALQKDEFETDAEYQARVAKSAAGASGDNKPKFQAAMDLVRTEYEKQISPLKQQMQTISETPYKVYGHDSLQLVLSKYDADRECFQLTVASKSIARPVYARQHLQFVIEVKGQAREVGIKKGDVLLRYNGHDIGPTTDWDALKQTVLSATTTLEVDRDGQALSFQLQKGRIGSSEGPRDYMSRLEADQFLVNGSLHVPRSEARQFKQDYGNGFVTAELQVVARTPQLAMVTSALVIDEATDRRYDLFKSPYVHMGNWLTYDLANELFWITGTYGGRNYRGAERFVQRLSFKGTKGWMLPTLEQLRRIRNAEATWRYGFHDRYVYTKNPIENSRNHYQYRLSDGRTDSGDSEQESVLAVSSALALPSYEFCHDRFVDLSSDMVFDTTTRLIWLMRPPARTFTYLEADAFVKQFVHAELRGWRLPEYNEIAALWDDANPGVDSRHRDALTRYFYTRSRRQNSHNHYQYRPSDNRTDSGDSERESILPVM